MTDVGRSFLSLVPRPVLILGTLLLVAFGINSVRRAHDPEGSSEFRGFRDNVAYPAFERRDIYEKVANPHRRASPDRVSLAFYPFAADRVIYGTIELSHPRFYPVLFAVIFYPFARAGTLFGAALWYLANVGLGVWALYLAVRTVSPSPTRRLIVAAFFAGIVLILDCAARGEPDPFVLFSLCLCFYLYVGKREFLAGVAGAFGAVFKVTPTFLFIYFLVKWRPRVLAGGLCGGILFGFVVPAAALGPRYMLDTYESWVRNVLVPYHGKGSVALVHSAFRSSHQSLYSSLHRHLQRNNLGTKKRPLYLNIADLPEPQLKRILTALKALILGAILLAWLWPRTRGASEVVTLELALIPPAMLELGDVSLTTHHLSLAFTLIALFAFAGTHPRLPKAAFWLGLAAMYLTAFEILKLLSILCLGTILTLCLTVVLIIREKRTGTAAAA